MSTIEKAYSSKVTGVLIVAGDMNLGTEAVLTCLSEVASQTNQTLVGMTAPGSKADRDWVLSNVAAMTGIHMTGIRPVDEKDHAVVGVKFTKAIGDIPPRPKCTAGSDAVMAEIISSLKERRQRLAKETEDRQRLEEENDPTSRVQGEVRPQPAIVTEQFTAPPTPVQPTEIDLRSPTSPADDDEGETLVRETLLELRRLRGAARVEKDDAC